MGPPTRRQGCPNRQQQWAEILAPPAGSKSLRQRVRACIGILILIGERRACCISCLELKARPKALLMGGGSLTCSRSWDTRSYLRRVG